MIADIESNNTNEVININISRRNIYIALCINISTLIAMMAFLVFSIIYIVIIVYYCLDDDLKEEIFTSLIIISMFILISLLIALIYICLYSLYLYFRN